MADRYLLESGAPDGYLLEDASGVLLLEPPILTEFDTSSAGDNIQGGTAGSGETNQQFAQSFQLAEDSDVETVAIWIRSLTGSPTDDLICDIQTTLDGTPLGSATAPNARLKNHLESYAPFYFSTPVALLAATTYYLQVRRSGARSASNVFEWGKSTGGGYANGTRWVRDNLVWSNPVPGADMRFRVMGYVSAAPPTEDPHPYIGGGFYG